MRRRRLDAAPEGDLLPGRPPVAEGLVLPSASVPDVSHVRVPSPEEPGEIGVLHPDHALLAMVDRLTRELLA